MIMLIASRILYIQWNLLITDIQGIGQNGSYVQVTAIDR